MKDKSYLSDEQLMALIEDVEQNNLIEAPRQLKGNILLEISKRRHRAKVVNIATYRMKVAAACAASILLFCVLPFGMPSTIERVELSANRREMVNDRIEIIEDFLETGRNEGERVKDRIDDFISGSLFGFRR